MGKNLCHQLNIYSPLHISFNTVNNINNMFSVSYLQYSLILVTAGVCVSSSTDGNALGAVINQWLLSTET